MALTQHPPARMEAVEVRIKRPQIVQGPEYPHMMIWKGRELSYLSEPVME